MAHELEESNQPPPWYRLDPVEHKGRWFWIGILLELIGMAGPVAYVLIKAKKASVGGAVGQATVKLAWHDSVHSKAGLAVLICGALVVAIGGALVARPYVSNVLVWLVAVPVASVAAALLLGAGALIILLIVACVYAGLDGWDFGGGTSSTRRRKKSGGAGPWSGR